MKAKYKCLIKALLFTFIFVFLFFSVQWCFISHSDPSYQNISGFYDESEGSLDAVYIGSSNGFTYWNPAVAWDEYGIAVYSYSANNLLFESAEYIIKDCVKTQPQAKFIVNINTLVGDELEMKEIHYTASNMPYSRNRFALVKHLCDIGNFSFSDRLEYYFPIVRFHDNYSALFPSTLFFKNDGYKGSSTYEPYVRIVTDVSADYGKSDVVGELPEYLSETIDSLLDYCDENKVEVVFVTVPQARSEAKNKVYNAINDKISSRGYTCLNLMQKEDETHIDSKTDFYNIQHTNIHGSVKYTHYISKYLIENFGFVDKRGQKEYADWDGMTEGYFKAVSPYILDFERDISCRDFELDAPENLTLDDSSVRWNSVENADYYAVYKKESKTSSWNKIEGKLYETEYTDGNYAEGDIYTVVPVVVKDGKEYYGNYPYLGVPVDEKDVGGVKSSTTLEE